MAVIQDFIDKNIRVIIGDSYPTHSYPKPTDPQHQRAIDQIVKYPSDVLLDILNEGVLDIAQYSKLFKKKGYALISANTRHIAVPADFKGLYSMSEVAKTSKSYCSMGTDIQIKPTHSGLELKEPITSADIASYHNRIGNVIIPADVANILYSTGQLQVDNVTQLNNLTFDSLSEYMLLEYWYLALPVEYSLTDTIDDRELMYLLKWWTASRAIVLDLHNEASNLYKMYENFYLRRLENAGETVHVWNYIPVSPYSAQY